MTDPGGPTVAGLAAAIGAQPEFAHIKPADLTRLRRKGVSHDHYAIAGRPVVARVPRLSQWDLDGDAFLAYQRAAFNRAAPAGHTPRLHAVIPPATDLPGGALLVDRIDGKPPGLPASMPAIASALAAIHTLPVPRSTDRAPLDHTDATIAIVQRIENQAAYLDKADLPRETFAALVEERVWARTFAADPPAPAPAVLVGTDTHPGNFLIDDQGHAWFVDLEKAAYGNPAIDLAHASLPTSTGWDPDCQGDLARADIAAFYEHYRSRTEPSHWTQLARWLLPARRLTWLRTITWFARWRREFASAPATPDDPAIRAHIERHIDSCLTPEAVAAVRHQWLEPNRLSLD